mmetsp:Transcript_8527/g.19087  ORF Transcript_8527/g.19087 Transcript_8527/m.19087 type:complete len:149 (-) Transcript_8527:143-589(-)|eukprot:CAMPEP_0172305830 /NCGR_PEP_ID=MMETSP1058-20130122/7049_1 /TAXON_ID=83371 /ORGANISM="Detonula confervacea, Strain CCMP 353" /LENGTH=148 /DNA_ID=CAMNT_0013017549 /DNA_START=235 /DNA_END=681 /DNA_ORIENTATION=+
MLRSTQSFLKQATKLSGSSIPLAASCAPSSNNASLLLARSSSTSNSSSSDYDKIMHSMPISNFFSATGGDSLPTPSSSTRFSTISPMILSGMVSAATAQVPSGPGVAQNASNYRSVVEPTGYEDYDTYELHHPPCERTHMSQYDAIVE